MTPNARRDRYRSHSPGPYVAKPSAPSAVCAARHKGARYRASLAIGQRAEERALDAAALLPGWWFLSARAATRHEDVCGVDIVIWTRDVGRICLQIKSSHRRAAMFEEHAREHGTRWRIHTLVVRPDDDDATVFGRVLGTVIKAREEALAAGRFADDPRLLALAEAA